MARLRLSKVVYARARAWTPVMLCQLTSRRNKEGKKFLGQLVVPMASTNWHSYIQATCFVVRLRLLKRRCTRARAWTPAPWRLNLKKEHGSEKVPRPTCSTHGCYNLVALKAMYPFWLTSGMHLKLVFRKTGFSVSRHKFSLKAATKANK